MNNLNEFKTTRQTSLETIGGEILAGSGFETEIPDSEFSEPSYSNESVGR